MNTILSCKNLNKTYITDKKNSYQALKNININIEKGEFVAVMGASGSGKSTLLYNISGMDRADNGSIAFNGQNLDHLNEEELATVRLSQMGFVFQQSNLLRNLNILDNIMLTAFLNKKVSRDIIKKNAVSLMKKTAIFHIADKDITQVSGGELQRASICRALINDPPIIFADEPTGALNSKSTCEVMDIFNQINESGTTILLVTHDPKVAARCERVLFMRDGVIVSEIKLGKENNKDKQNKSIREKILGEWLEGLNF